MSCDCQCLQCVHVTCRMVMHHKVIFQITIIENTPFLLPSLPSPSSLDIPRLPTVERKELFNAIFDIAVYWPPANIHLPEDYEPPKLAISKLYWKGWILLLVLAAFNPKTIGVCVGGGCGCVCVGGGGVCVGGGAWVGGGGVCVCVCVCVLGKAVCFLLCATVAKYLHVAP